ncbi:MAG: M23 family metallopeptidase [Synergistaceae bacterium]|nr:M23 family metallopeptidase [Synergistaceae bacterium]
MNHEKRGALGCLRHAAVLTCLAWILLITPSFADEARDAGGAGGTQESGGRLSEIYAEKGIASADANDRLVTVKLHGVPRDTSDLNIKGLTPREQRPKPPAVQPSPPVPQKPSQPPSQPSQPKLDLKPSSFRMTWPVNGKISSGYGRRGKKGRMHMGIDIPVPKGTPIKAAMDGVVTQAGKKYRGYGYSVTIDHGGGISSFYAHCSSVKVRPGQAVKRGAIVGLVGRTGRAVGHHLHFEVRKNGKAVNPLPYLEAR